MYSSWTNISGISTNIWYYTYQHSWDVLSFQDEELLIPHHGLIVLASNEYKGA